MLHRRRLVALRVCAGLRRRMGLGLGGACDRRMGRDGRRRRVLIRESRSPVDCKSSDYISKQL